MAKRILIVGGVAGGASCAARLRRLDEDAEIVLFERGEYISFANCGLPYYVGGVIPKREALLVQDPKTMKAWFNIDIYVQTEVTAIQPEQKTVTVLNRATGEVRSERYDVLVLSPGAEPVVPEVPGVDEACERLFTIRNVHDVDRLKTYMDNENPKRAVVIGGGYIGLEMAENLVQKGLNVSIVQRRNQVLAPLDVEMAALVHAELRKKGVHLYLEQPLAGFEDAGRVVRLSTGTTLEADLVVLAVGVRPESKLISDIGLATNKRGAIITDDQFHVAGAPDVYAIGDAVEVKNFVTGENVMIPLAGPANRMGRMCADIICGQDKHYKGTLGSSVVRVFDVSCANTGKNERQLKASGIPYQSIHLYPANHATYYPGASQLCLKVIYAPEDGRLLGAQCVGKAGVDKVIDVVATAIYAKMSVYDLQDLELCYAPPFGTAKSPLNFAGYIAENILRGEKYLDDAASIDTLLEQGAFVLDVRGKKETEKVPMPASLNISLPTLRANMDKLPKDEVIYVTCMVGIRGHIASRMLQANGCDVVTVGGGAKLYNQHKLV